MKLGINDLFKQAGQMQEKMARLQEQLADATVEGESGAGLVKVTMNGRHDVASVMIDDSLMNEDRAVLQDLIAAAINDTVRRVEENNRKVMAAAMEELGLPANAANPWGM